MRLLSIAIALSTLTALVAAQGSQSTDRPTFEVASIKPNKSAESRNGADAAKRASGERMPPWVELERWELRLEARRAPVNVFVLETAEPPEE